MNNSDIFKPILDSLEIPIVFVNSQHCITYMNAAGQKLYARFGDILGKSIFDCHNTESKNKIEAIYAQLQAGAQEALYSENEKRKIYMRAVRDPAGNLSGYYERYETPGAV